MQLNQFVAEWNHHRIRPSKKADAPAGVPEVMFNCPQIYGIVNVTYYCVILQNPSTCRYTKLCS